MICHETNSIKGVVDLNLGKVVKKAYNYFFVFPWIEYFEEPLSFLSEQRRLLDLRNFRGKFVKKDEFDPLLEEFGHGIGEGSVVPRDLDGRETRAEAEWALIKEQRDQIRQAQIEHAQQDRAPTNAAPEPAERQVVQRRQGMRSVREEMSTQDNLIHQLGNEVQAAFEEQQRSGSVLGE